MQSDKKFTHDTLCGGCRRGNQSHTCNTGDGHTYCVHCIHTACQKYSLPTIYVRLDHISTKLEEVDWNEGPALEVLKDENSPHHRRIEEADLLYPICLTDKYDLLDGSHRIFKAYRRGYTGVLAVIIPPSILEQCKKVMIPPQFKYSKKRLPTEDRNRKDIFCRYYGR
jgi:hypothetical protein